MVVYTHMYMCAYVHRHLHTESLSLVFINLAKAAVPINITPQ